MTLRLSALFLVSLLFGLVAHAPADKLIPHVLPEQLGLKLHELEGSIFSGRAGYVEVQGTGARNLKWELQPLQLLMLKLGVDVELSLDSRDPRQDNSWLSGTLEVGLLSREAELRDLEAVAPLAALKQPLKLAFMPMTGNVYLSLDLLRADLGERRLLEVNGRARLLDAQFQVGRPAALGNYGAEITTESGVIQASIEDEDSGTVDLDAQASLNPDGEYRLQARLKPKLDTPAPVANSMKALGRTDRQGWYPITQQGALPQP